MIPTLQTERLTLRAMSEDDLDPLAAWFETDDSAILGGPFSRGHVWRSIALMLGHWQLRGFGMWSVTDTATGQFLGRVGPWFPESWPDREIGWMLLPEARGKGIAFEAAQAARTYAYDTLGWTTAISLIDPKNTASQALATRLGATHERSHEHPEWGELQLWRHPAREALQ